MSVMMTGPFSQKGPRLQWIGLGGHGIGAAGPVVRVSLISYPDYSDVCLYSDEK